MENASKALIIAGAILLAISIIGIGMYVFQQAQGAMSGVGMDSEKAAAYNQKFDSYVGTTVKGTEVRALYDVVRNHNVSNQADESLLVSINGKTTSSDLNKERAAILQGKTYIVSVADDGYDTGTGYIKAITVTANK